MVYEQHHFDGLNNMVANALDLPCEDIEADSDIIINPNIMLGYLVAYYLGELPESQFDNLCDRLRRFPYFQTLADLYYG